MTTTTEHWTGIPGEYGSKLTGNTTSIYEPVTPKPKAKQSPLMTELRLNALSDSLNGGLSEIHRQQLSNTVKRVQARFELLESLADACLRINADNKKNYPQRSPEWAVDFHGNSETQSAMNDLLAALNKLEA